MSMSAPSSTPHEVEYPDSDGEPMAENTLQFEWIVTIKEGLAALFADRPDVFVAGDLLWYPVEGDPKTRLAPDALVAFGRPPGYRGSYMQWKEGGIAPQVVFEVLSPGNREAAMQAKRAFYERFGVEEYYVYDPDENRLDGWRRVNGRFQAIDPMDGWTSPRLGIRFELIANNLHIYRPDGERFFTYLEMFEARKAERQRAEAQLHRADAERQRADAERQRADAEQHRAEAAQLQADTERQRAERLAERLRAMGIDPETV